LKFYISWREERKRLIGLFRGFDPLGIDSRAKQCNFSKRLAKKIHSKSPEEWMPILNQLLKKTYKDESKKMREALVFFEKYWQKNDKNFFEKLEIIFKEKIPTYNVLLSYYVAGTSDWYGENICTNIYSYKWKKKNSHVYSLLFEVILSQVFKRIRRNKSQKDISDEKVWSASELSAFIILHQEWNIFDNMQITRYKEVDNFIYDAQKIYKSAKDIDIFIEKILLLKN
ncbi:MAG TPA: hypothetical protein VLL98_02085, partial [Rickettsiales bacterium]|nr:hypothetical protein [Rickettsiales bacterium]